jgi:hypothetical protein
MPKINVTMPMKRPPGDGTATNTTTSRFLFINQAKYTPDNQKNTYNEFGVLKPENYQNAGYNSNYSHCSIAQGDSLFGHDESAPPRVEIMLKMICF